MKAIEIQTFGPPEGLAVVDRPEPVPAADEVLIATESIGVGGVDVLIRSGAVAAYGFREGHIPGSEVAGTVVAVGAVVDPTWVGRRVWAFIGLGGGYAEFAVAPAETLLPLPDELSTAAAVTLGTSGSVAHFGLRHAQLAAGESVLVRGAGGGIGVLAVQLAVAAGAGTVAVTASSPVRGDRLRSLGATQVLDRSGRGADNDPVGFDVIIDIIAGPGLAAFVDRLNPNGRLVSVGAVAGNPPSDLTDRLFAQFQRSLSFATFSANTISDAERRRVTAEIFAAAVRGDVQAVVQDELPLAEAVLAHQRMAAGEVFGRLVLTT